MTGFDYCITSWEDKHGCAYYVTYNPKRASEGLPAYSAHWSDGDERGQLTYYTDTRQQAAADIRDPECAPAI